MTPLDDLILRLASDNKSPQEIALELGLEPEEVLLKVRSLLGDRDSWGERVKFSLLLDNLYELKDFLWRDLKSTGDPRSASNLLRTLEQLGKTLDQISALNREVTDAVTEQNAVFLVNLVATAMKDAHDSLSGQHPELPWDEIHAALREGLHNAAS